MRKANFIKSIVIIMLLSTFTFIGCKNSTSSGDSGPTEYTGGTVNIIDSYWDGVMKILNNNISVYVYIPDDSHYDFVVIGIPAYNNSGTYARTGNKATLTSTKEDNTKGKVMGTAVMTSPDEITLILSENAPFPGTYYLHRRK